jgi:hypothetical protein
MEQATSVRLHELSRRLALLHDEIERIDPDDTNAVEALQGRFMDWWHELYVLLGPYTARWEVMKEPVRPAHRLRRTPLGHLQGSVAVYRRRLADVLQGWED